MRTYTWRSAEIQQDLALLEEAIFLVELNELEGSTGSVTFLLGELVPFVKTTLSVLLLDRHGQVYGCKKPCSVGPDRKKRLKKNPRGDEDVEEGNATDEHAQTVWFPNSLQEFFGPIR